MHQSAELDLLDQPAIKVYGIVDKKLAMWEINFCSTHGEAIEMVKQEAPKNITLMAVIK